MRPGASVHGCPPQPSPSLYSYDPTPLRNTPAQSYKCSLPRHARADSPRAGPYFGQKAWFTMFHPEKNITSAIERYANEIKRVVGVVDRHLREHGTGWLVGGKCTYADLVWVPWDMLMPFLLSDGQKVLDEHPHFKKWHEAMMARPAVAKMAEEKAKASKH